MGAIGQKHIKILKVLLGLILVVSSIAVILAFCVILTGNGNNDVDGYTYVNSLGIDVDGPQIAYVSEVLAPQAKAEPQTADAHSYEDIDSLFHSMGINLHQQDPVVDQTSQDSINYCKKLVYQGLTAIPQYHSEALTDLTLTLKDEGKRGLAGNGVMILRCKGISDSDLVAVLLHEMGHIVDGSYLIGTLGSGKSEFVDLGTPVPSDDKSVEYYQLSWKNNYNLKETSTKNDFCSDYGQTDPYEDFAECYIYYILHGEEFRKTAEENTLLKAKYDFLKTNVFSGIEYSYDENSVPDKRILPTDVVQLPYNYNSFLNQ